MTMTLRINIIAVSPGRSWSWSVNTTNLTLWPVGRSRSTWGEPMQTLGEHANSTDRLQPGITPWQPCEPLHHHDIYICPVIFYYSVALAGMLYHRSVDPEPSVLKRGSPHFYIYSITVWINGPVSFILLNH